MRKIYKKLTKDQIARGVIFSSTLSKHTTEQSTDTIHEVMANDPERGIMIRNLKNDKFFDGSPWKYNIIRS